MCRRQIPETISHGDARAVSTGYPDPGLPSARSTANAPALSSGTGAAGLKHIDFFALAFKPAIAEREYRQNEKIERHRCEKAAQDHDRHGPFDLATRIACANRQWQHAKRRHNG